MKTCIHPDLALQSVFQEPMMSEFLDSPDLNQRISEWQTLDLRSPSPRPSTAARSSWEVPSDQVSTAGCWGGQSWDSIAVDTSGSFSTVPWGDPCAKSPFRGHESPRHLLFKKWYRQETLGGSGVGSWFGLRSDEQWQRIEARMLEVYPMLRGCSETTFVKNLGASSTWQRSKLQVRQLPTAQLRSQCFRFWPQCRTRTTRKTLCVTRSKCTFSLLASRLFFLVDNVARAFRAFVDSFFRSRDEWGNRQASPKKWLMRVLF